MVLLSLSVGNAWGSSYYAKLTASLSDGAGSGTVYVASPSKEATEAANDASAHATSKDATSADSQSTDFYFTVYATAARGSMFSSWTTPTGNGNPAIYTDGGYSTTSNPVLVKVTSADSNGTNEATIQANFAANPVPPFDVYFLEPEGNGTYTVSSYIGYPEPVQGGDPVSSYNTDEIVLTATNGEGYGFRRFYYVDAEDKKKTLGSFAQKEQLVTLSPEMKKIGCEFVAAWEANYVTATNGSYTAANGSTAITVDSDPSTTTTTYADDNIKLTATPKANYAFFRFVGTDALGNTYTIGTIGLGTQTVNIPQNTVSITAEFTDKPFVVGTNVYSDLDGAIQATRKDDGTYKGVILLVNNDTVPAGYYTIPAGVTLLIPVDANQVQPTTRVAIFDDVYGSATEKAIAAKKPTKSYKKLTLLANAHLDVFGNIEVGGRQNGYANVGVGRPCGDTYGHLDMIAGSTITLESGSNLYAWGYVTGDGDIDVRRGACVHEDFQIYDWHGGGQAYTLYTNTYGVFVVTQYFIQNVEAKAKYRPGSALYCYTSLLASVIDPIKVIGVEGDAAAMFTMNNEDDSEDTWVCKSYNYSTDQQVYEINNAAKLGNLQIIYSSYVYNSANFTLPVTCNMKIHVLSGRMQVRQNTVMLPGSEIEIDKEATGYVEPNMSLFLVDSCDWDKWVFGSPSAVYAQRVTVRPGGAVPTEKQRKLVNADGSCALAPAKLNVHGTFVADGDIYTSYAKNVDNTLTESNRGASIISTNADAGTFIFNHTAPTAEKSVYARRYKDAWPEMKCVSAKLLNGDGTYATTAGTPAGQSYCYMNGKWIMMTVDPENECFVYDNYGTYYAKPGAYVALANGKTENSDHTYSDADGRGRLYILMDECQWWEVVLENNLYKGIVRDAEGVASPNGKYYVYNTSTNKWEEKRYTITWKDWDGTVIGTYQLTYGTTPQYLSTNPTRPADVDYTYNFTGWSPAFAPVTGDQAYTATYSKTQIKYTVIFKFVDDVNDGAEIERQQLARDEMPTIPSLTPRDGWYLKWTPAIGAVTGDQIYEAEWIENLPDNYTITWKNYDGSTIKTTSPARDASAEMVLAGAPSTPEKPATKEYRYEFNGWQPAVTSATADASYVAQYREVAQTYAIRFFKEDGTTQIDETQSLPLGADPVVPNYSKANTAQYTFRLQWKNMDTDVIVGVSVPSVSASANYQAVIDTTINRYTITAKSEVEGESGNIAGCTFTGAGTYDYGTNITLKAIPNEGYEFVKWEDNNNIDSARSFNVAENITYTAIVRGAPVMKVRNDETKVVEEGTKVSALVISATPTSSTDLVDADNLQTPSGESSDNIPVYFDLTRGAGKVFKHHTWYAFSVPFQVDASQIQFDGQTMQYNTVSKKDDYDILYYDGSVRAAQGKAASCWKYVEKDDPTYLYPGKLYMIANTRRDVTTLRFTKVAGTALLTTSVDVASHTSANNADANWNGIANPALFHADMSGLEVAAGQVYVYNPDFTDPTNAYIPLNLSTDKIILGEAFFAQIPSTKTFSVSSSPASAPYRRSPARAKVNKEGYYQISVAESGKASTDEIIIRMDEDKAEDTYIIGQDLTRMGMSTINPQIWVNRYNEKLRVNVVAPNNGKANYPLGIFVPATGDYTLSLAAQPNDENMLYLTKDGRVIWNLTYGPYTGVFEQGTTSSYALRIVAAPKVTTDVEEAIVDAQGETRKVLINNQVFIIRGDQVYTIEGQLVK